MFRFHLARFVFKIIQTIISQFVVYGRQNIPEQGPYIVAVNHVSTADTPLLLLAFPAHRWRFFAGEKWQEHWFFGPVMGYLGAIYINRGQVDRGALKEAMAAIEEGAVFGLAPEGTRSKNGSMQAAKDGAAYLAVRSQVPVVPVGLVNSDTLFENAGRFRRSRIEAFVGEPFLMPELGRRVRSRDLAAYTHLTMVKIAAQLPPRYHGLYAGSPALEALQAGKDPWPYCLALIEEKERK